MSDDKATKALRAANEADAAYLRGLEDGRREAEGLAPLASVGDDFEGHTPGPLVTDEEDGLLVVGDAATGACLAEIHLDGDVPPDVARVNGELFAKAPDLLRERDALRAKLKGLEGADLYVIDLHKANSELTLAAQKLERERDEARQQRNALADANTQMLDHLRRLQRLASDALEPTAARADLFDRLLYLVDGPEQRAAQAVAEAARRGTPLEPVLATLLLECRDVIQRRHGSCYSGLLDKVEAALAKVGR